MVGGAGGHGRPSSGKERRGGAAPQAASQAPSAQQMPRPSCAPIGAGAGAGDPAGDSANDADGDDGITGVGAAVEPLPGMKPPLVWSSAFATGEWLHTCVPGPSSQPSD